MPTTKTHKPKQAAPLSVRLPRDLEAELRRRAATEDRPVNQLVKAALAEYLEVDTAA